MWKDLSIEWQAAFAEAWNAFCRGSVPIGAALFDENGQQAAVDRNRCAESDTVNRRISHAEANLLRGLSTDRYRNLQRMKLYTTMEPCPMCMGTIVMANIRDVSYAAADAYCGAIHLLADDPYMNGKRTRVQHMGGGHELFQLVLQSYYELRLMDSGYTGKVLENFEKTSPDAVRIARELYRDRLLDQWAGEKTANEVFDLIAGFHE